LSFYVEIERASDTGGSEEYVNVRATNNNERVRLGVNSSDLAFSQVNAGGVDQGVVSVAGAIAVGSVVKLACRVNTNSIQTAKGGTLGTEDTSATLPSSPNEIQLSPGNPPYGYLRRLAIFSRALSDGELQALTA